MNDTSTLRIAAAFSFLSPLAIVAGVPFAASLGGVGGPGPIDFGDGVRLDRLAELGAAAVRVDLFALLGPVFAVPAVFGWYLLLRPTSRSAAQLGVALWLFGMVFIVMQDALQLALVSTLPAAHAAADIETRAAIEAVGGSLGYAIEVLAFTGHMPNGIGVPVGIMLLLVCIAALGVVMLREAGRLAGAPDGRVLAGSA
jgi:hypothetical protein